VKTLRIAYLVNQYPGPSHSFIRREIAALEAQGVEILRFTVRRAKANLPDEADIAELSRTRAILEAGSVTLLLRTLVALVTRPIAVLRAFGLAVKFGWPSLRAVLRNIVYLAEACTLAHWLAQGRAEHLHAHFGTNSAMVAMLCHIVGGFSYSFTAHGPEEFDRAESLGLGEKVRRAAFVIAVCNFGRCQLFRWCRLEDWKKVEVVHCGLGPDLLKTSTDVAPTDSRLVCVARLGEQKGHLLLLEAAAKLKQEGIEFELVLVGDGPMRQLVERRIRELDLADRIVLTGWLSGKDVRKQIVTSRALLLPSFAEGLPVVLMEAFILGRPVVATYVAGIPELVEAGASGWLVPAGSVDALAEAMRAVLLATPMQLSQMAKLGAKRVLSDHDAFHEAAKLAALFRRQTNRNPDNRLESLGEEHDGSTSRNHHP
jgi:glycosyltransferase involved in cell wall biosynthesis